MRKIDFVLPLVVVAGFCCGYYICESLKKPTAKPDYSNLNSKIDSLQFIVDSLEDRGDSIKVAVSNSDKVIAKKKENYEQTKTVIINQPVSADIEFFTKFLSKADSGFISSDYDKTIKKN